jgi:polyhydroxyalkanoate synthase subunit PhaE
MKTNNPFIDNMVDAQAHVMNNFMESAKKMQSAFTNGSAMHEGQGIYKEWLDKQMNILNGMQNQSASFFGNNQNVNNPQEFFKNWYNQQMGNMKQMTDFNQSIYNSYANFGKPASDYMSNFNTMNNAWTNIYNSWMNTLNTSYDSMMKNMNGSFNKDMFANYMQGNQMYLKMQEFFQPMTEAMQKGQFNLDAFKNYFNAEHYKTVAQQMFGNLYNGGNLKEVYEQGMKQMQNFFVNQNNMSKEYYAQVQNMANEYPQLFSGNFDKMKELYSQMNNVFGKTFEPLLKLVNPGKEKENVEATIALMDKMAEYSIKQAELQFHLQTTTQKSIEAVAKQYSERYSKPEAFTQMPSAQEMYNEWVKTNENLFTELFASEAFSKVKGETLNLSMDVKKHFEKQFENVFEQYPLVFKSEVEELHKTVYELKKQIKELQVKLAVSNAASVELFDDEKAQKNKKK